MKILNLLFFFIFTTLLYSCDEEVDPCAINANSLECPSGDFDNDGVVNSEDLAPEDECIPNKPSFEENIVGSWNWNYAGDTGRISINEDGSYQDVYNEIYISGNYGDKTWRIESGKLILQFGYGSLDLEWLEYDCELITFDGQYFPDITFFRFL